MLSNRAALFETFVNVPHRILGKTLKDFSLLHYLWLEQVQSPLIYTAKTVAPADLRLAVVICSQDTSEGILAAIKREKAWYRRLFSLRISNLERELKAFLAYIDDFLCLPEYADSEGESVERLPWLLISAATVIQATGWSEETVWKMPLGKILWYSSTFSYLKTGETNIISDKEKIAEAALKALTAPAI